MKTLAQGLNTAAQDSNQVPLSRESDALPLSHGACNFSLLVPFKSIDNNNYEYVHACWKAGNRSARQGHWLIISILLQNKCVTF